MVISSTSTHLSSTSTSSRYRIGQIRPAPVEVSHRRGANASRCTRIGRRGDTLTDSDPCVQTMIHVSTADGSEPHLRTSPYAYAYSSLFRRSTMYETSLFLPTSSTSPSSIHSPCTISISAFLFRCNITHSSRLSSDYAATNSLGIVETHLHVSGISGRFRSIAMAYVPSGFLPFSHGTKQTLTASLSFRGNRLLYEIPKLMIFSAPSRPDLRVS
jgi:hypothetical protein